MSLDTPTAAQSRTCSLIGKECYTYITDPEANIADLVPHKEKTIAQVEKLSFVDYFTTWLNFLLGE